MRFDMGFLITLLLLCVIWGCGGSEVTLGGGGGTETVGTIVTQDGDPAAGAKVLFVPFDYNATPDDDDSDYRIDLQPDSVFANYKGEFPLSDISDGIYNIFYEQNGDRALRRNVHISGGKADTTIHDTLASSGEIQGVVRLRPEHNSKDVYILLIGTNRYYVPYDSSGTFSLNNLPAGVYNVRFVAREKFYDEVDTMLTVREGKSDTLSDTIVMPYDGLLPPTEVTVRYDEDLQQTHLSWDKIESKRLIGYQVKRRENSPGSEFDVIATKLTTTSFIDNMYSDTVKQGKEYIYSVQAIDEYGVTGKPTCSDLVTYNSSFELQKSTFVELGAVSPWGNIERDHWGRMWVTSIETNELIIVDEDSWGPQKRIDMSLRGAPLDIERMSDSTMLVATSIGIYNLDRNGDSLHFFPIETYDIACSDAQFLYYCERTEEQRMAIRKFDMLEGVTTTLLDNERFDIGSITIVDETIYVAFHHYGDVYLVSSGLECYMPQRIYHKQGNNGEIDIAVDNGVVRLLASQEVCTFSPQRKLLSRTRVAESSIALATNAQNGFTLWDYNGILAAFTKK